MAQNRFPHHVQELAHVLAAEGLIDDPRTAYPANLSMKNLPGDASTGLMFRMD